jgi:hypothetical protein
MAELGMLKHVDVISTVSGGSIVGAAYYLLLKRLLESKPDKAAGAGDLRLADNRIPYIPSIGFSSTRSES